MARRAIQAFLQQTYQRKRLIIWNTGTEPPFDNFEYENVWMPEVDAAGCAAMTIGALRNLANKYATFAATSDSRPDIFIHWDDDDVSHPARIAEQVALLQASGKECVGYRECLFWQEPRAGRDERSFFPKQFPGEAWLYQNADPRRALGASLCYWRSVWEKRPFPDLPKTRNGTAEDTEWLKGVDSLGVTAMDNGTFMRDLAQGIQPAQDAFQPRMVCSIHAGNSTDYDPAGLVRNGSPNWKRVPEWDDYCREKMKL